MSKTIEIINKMIEVYKNEMINCEDLKKDLRDKLIEGRQQLQNKSPRAIETMQEILTLGETIRNGEVAIKTLELLKKELTSAGF